MVDDLLGLTPTTLAAQLARAWRDRSQLLALLRANADHIERLTERLASGS